MPSELSFEATLLLTKF